MTRAFVRLTNLPIYPLDRLNRYEAALWRQACQILFTLQCLSRPNEISLIYPDFDRPSSSTGRDAKNYLESDF